MTIARADGLLYVPDPSRLRLLFMAPYAPNAPDYQMNPYTGDGTYPDYHFKVYTRLKDLGFGVESSSKPYTIVHSGGAIDYVFSLFNRMPIHNSEVFVSAYCEFLNLAYLGAGPNIRAVAEDKYVSKLVAQSLGIPAASGIVYHRGITPLDIPPPFRGPYFIKDRFGAASERITLSSLQEEWLGTKREIERLWDADTDALVEQYVDGIDITVPVIGDDFPRILGVFEPLSDKPGNILTHDLKLTDHLGYREVDVGALRSDIEADVHRLWRALGAIDYFRVDYRLSPGAERSFLELNICCYLGEHGPFGMAATRDGASIHALTSHIVAYSLFRQRDRRNNGQWIL
jgi:D-alanine-D-alanine ligase